MSGLTRAQIEERRDELVAARQQIAAQMHRLNGGIAALDGLLSDIENETTSTPTLTVAATAEGADSCPATV